MMQLDALSSINQIDADEWNNLFKSTRGDTDKRMPYPFTQHGFLAALEDSHSVGEQAGWHPHHLILTDGDKLCAAVPSYLKSHSYGEYVFDWGWADAYHRYGYQYYPKLISAIPFTPVTGPRIGIASDLNNREIIDRLKACLHQHCRQNNISSWHLLFPEKNLSEQWPSDILTRTAVHFQWWNEGFSSFDDFLATFSSRKRKNLRKEREKIHQFGIEFETVSGCDITPEIWQSFYRFYQFTYAKRSGHGGYLSKKFFELLSETMPEQLVLVMAKQDGRYVAGALNFRDEKTLYGRYWGCEDEVDFLHFETCYYQGIDYCIQQSIQRFDPGVQGEHKIQRGFRPTYTYSNHWLAEPGFQTAIADFLRREKPEIEAYFKEAESLLPFRQE